jgi:N utilization substance protein B
MNVKQRINARKVILSYIYQYCFFDNLQNQDLVAVESLFIGNIFKTDNERFDTAKKEYLKDIKAYLKGPETEEDLLAFVDLFFDERDKADIDFDYLAKIGLTFVKHIPEITDKVNSLTESFKFDQMDTIDQALFILGYTEWIELETPKEILINEMIELAKRYSDDGSPKLLNGIMHKIVNNIS